MERLKKRGQKSGDRLPKKSGDRLPKTKSEKRGHEKRGQATGLARKAGTGYRPGYRPEPADGGAASSLAPCAGTARVSIQATTDCDALAGADWRNTRCGWQEYGTTEKCPTIT